MIELSEITNNSLTFWFTQTCHLAIPSIALPELQYCVLPTEDENYLYDVRNLYENGLYVNKLERIQSLCGYDLLSRYNQSLGTYRQLITFNMNDISQIN